MKNDTSNTADLSTISVVELASEYKSITIDIYHISGQQKCKKKTYDTTDINDIRVNAPKDFPRAIYFQLYGDDRIFLGTYNVAKDKFYQTK